MPRPKSGNFDSNKYVTEYMKENIRHIKVSLNKSKPDDVKVINWIESQPEGASGYIKRLVREDMEVAKARLYKVTDFEEEKLGSGAQMNQFVWMEIRPGWYKRDCLDNYYGGKPYPALLCGWQDMRCKLDLDTGKSHHYVCRVEIQGGYESMFNIFDDYGTGLNHKWRLWTAKPTEEQIANTPWDVGTIT